jgi:hypothetical protein
MTHISFKPILAILILGKLKSDMMEKGRGHTNKFFEIEIETPHVHDPHYQGGVRPAADWEIPGR